MKEFISAIEENEADEFDAEEAIEFRVDGRVLHAYKPNEGQLTFILAALGRGQSQQDRFASIVNIMMSSLRGEDRDYLESRLLEREPSKRLRLKVVEGIFEYLAGEWFATPTQEPSDSAKSEPTASPN